MRLLKILEKTPGTHGDKEGITLDEWLQVTLELEREAFGQNPPMMTGDRLGDFWLAMLHACTEEVTEMGDECSYKTWVSPRGQVNRGAFISEAADLLHFVALLLCSVSCTGEELTVAYLSKVRKNYDRQAKGDDGTSRRCDGCRRSLDDVGTHLVGSFEGAHRVCNSCGYIQKENK